MRLSNFAHQVKNITSVALTYNRIKTDAITLESIWESYMEDTRDVSI